MKFEVNPGEFDRTAFAVLEAIEERHKQRPSTPLMGVSGYDHVVPLMSTLRLGRSALAEAYAAWRPMSPWQLECARDGVTVVIGGLMGEVSDHVGDWYVEVE